MQCWSQFKCREAPKSRYTGAGRYAVHHHAHGLGVLLTLRMDFLKMSMPPGSTIASYVASIRHATYHLEECYRVEEKDSISISSTTSPIISDLNMISVHLNGLPPSYQSVIVNITGTPLASLTFEDVVTRLMNEEGRLRNVVHISNLATSQASDRILKPMLLRHHHLFPDGKANHRSPPLRRTSLSSYVTNVEE